MTICIAIKAEWIVDFVDETRGAEALERIRDPKIHLDVTTSHGHGCFDVFVRLLLTGRLDRRFILCGAVHKW